jgi:hypothetical protein
MKVPTSEAMAATRRLRNVGGANVLLFTESENLTGATMAVHGAIPDLGKRARGLDVSIAALLRSGVETSLSFSVNRSIPDKS